MWAYAQPLLTMATYYLVFDVVFAMRVGEGASTRAVGTYLIAGMLPWMAFSDAVARAMNSLLESANVLQKILCPDALPRARCAGQQCGFALCCCSWCLPMSPLHHFAPALLLLPVLVGVQIVLCLLWEVCWPSWRLLCGTWCNWWVALSLGIFSPQCFSRPSLP